MNETMTLIAMLAAGLILGAIFFGGLWWTVQKGVLSGQPSVWFLGSLITRMGIIMAGFYFLSLGHWQRLLPIIAGVFTARFIFTRIIGKQDKQTDHISKGARHASQS